MYAEAMFLQAFIYMSAAIIVVPIAKRLGLGSVLGYLIAGMALGPSVLGLVGEEGQDVLHFSEFGVVMMLFVVGLELEPRLLWRLRLPILGLGGAQVGGTTLVIAGIAWAVGLSLPEALAVGLTLALSSTAIVLQTLSEKGLMNTSAGRSSFAVLLFQDIAVIPMLALFPLLATHGGAGGHGDGHGHESWIGALAPPVQAMVVIAAVGGIVVVGYGLTRPLFRAIAGTRLRELFVATVLMLVVGIALLMAKVGLSPALGTFVAGVVLAESEYRHELESDIEPFKGLLLGLFFISVGASIDFPLIARDPGTIAAIVVGLVVVKLGVLAGLGRVFRLSLDQNLLFAFALAQGGEFAFVLFSFAGQSGVLTSEVSAPLIAAVAVSMALTPLLMLFFEWGVRPRVGTREAPDRAFDAPERGKRVIIAGYGRFGQIASRLLATEGIEATVLEGDSDQVDLLRRFGRKVFYGDASRVDLLEAAGAAEADLLILALDRPETTLSIVHAVKKHYPRLEIMARARGRVDAYELRQAGVEHVFRETYESALALGRTALTLMGVRAHRALRAAQAFRRHDEALLRELAEHYGRQDFMSLVRARTQDVEEVMRRDRPDESRGSEAWDDASLRADDSLASRRPAKPPSPASRRQG